MPNNQAKKDLKHLGGFWPIFIIVIVSMIAGGVVYAFASGNMFQDDMDSISFVPHHNALKAAGKILPKPVINTNIETTNTK
jgi:hypothetical protein